MENEHDWFFASVIVEFHKDEGPSLNKYNRRIIRLMKYSYSIELSKDIHTDT